MGGVRPRRHGGIRLGGIRWALIAYAVVDVLPANLANPYVSACFALSGPPALFGQFNAPLFPALLAALLAVVAGAISLAHVDSK